MDEEGDGRKREVVIWHLTPRHIIWSPQGNERERETVRERGGGGGGGGRQR